MPESSPRKERARRLGGTIAVGIYALVLGALTLLWSAQIMIQVWSQNGTTTVSCRDGVRSLAAAVTRARAAAAAETRGERAAVEQFRAALDPEWSLRPALSRACRDDEQGRRLLREIDQWRYAEERSVRSDAADVARRRRRVQKLQAEIETPGASAAAPSGLANAPRAN